MKRVQLFEFEDFRWFPAWLRACMTNLIIVLLKMLGVPKVLASSIAKILKEYKIDTIVDLGSGSGGAMPEVLEILHKDFKLPKSKLILTDLYPNSDTIQKFKSNNHINYLETSVDATNIASAPAGLKTMVNSFHHMPPKAAKQILKSAQESNQPILIYEMAENKMPLLLWWILLPISLPILMVMSLFMTPLVKPLKWQQLVFTYLVPIIPIFYAWDGQASMPRLYALKDYDELLDGLQSDDYHWEKGLAKKENGKTLGTYCLGVPVK